MRLSASKPLPFIVAFLLFSFAVGIFFYPVWLYGRVPVPADTIVGMYHPWRDQVWDNYSNGVPFKNFLTTDPVRQLYPWRQLAIEIIRKGQLPLWNPYALTGIPLLANMQSAVFYPLNFLFFVTDFASAWQLLIILQPLLAAVFMYLYLRQLGLKPISGLIAGLVFAFCGFSVSWLEWGTIIHSALWLPLVLLSIDKIISSPKKRWLSLFVFALACSFFAGHLQTFAYLFLFSSFYLIFRLWRKKIGSKKTFLLLSISYLLLLLVVSVQLVPTLELIKLSARNIDQSEWQKAGWFIPWQNLVQFVAPDFFGNPTTLNYWGVFNYGEFIGYIGILPLMLAFIAVVSNRQKLVMFFTFSAVLALSFALPTPWAKLPFVLKLPFISSSQPTRLLFLVDFCLSVLAAFGVEKLINGKIKKKFLLFWPLLYAALWLIVRVDHLAVSQRNLILPTLVAFAGLTLVVVSVRYPKFRSLWLVLMVALVCFDLFRFAWKYTPFSQRNYLYPSTRIIDYLQADPEVFRFSAVDARLFPPNFTLPYHLSAISGYDPLYLLRYGELVAALSRNKPDINPPFGFNRIISPETTSSRLLNLMNVKYLISLTDLESENLELVMQEGASRLYLNHSYFPRAFLVHDWIIASGKQKAIELLFDEKINLRQTAVLETDQPAIGQTKLDVNDTVEISRYAENSVQLKTNSSQVGILILTDTYFPGWRVTVDGQEKDILLAYYNFRGVRLPPGEHQVVFSYD